MGWMFWYHITHSYGNQAKLWTGENNVASLVKRYYLNNARYDVVTMFNLSTIILLRNEAFRKKKQTYICVDVNETTMDQIYRAERRTLFWMLKRLEIDIETTTFDELRSVRMKYSLTYHKYSTQGNWRGFWIIQILLLHFYDKARPLNMRNEYSWWCANTHTHHLHTHTHKILVILVHTPVTTHCWNKVCDTQLKAKDNNQPLPWGDKQAMQDPYRHL